MFTFTTLRKAMTAFALCWMGVTAMSLAPPALAANPNDFFELDGNLVNNSSGKPDWTDIFTGNLPAKGATPNSSLPTGFSSPTFVPDFNVDNNNDDTVFATGSKDTLNILGGWECKKANNISDKSDINNAYAVAATKTVGGVPHLLVYFALDVASNDGTKNVAFWFLKDPTVNCVASGGGATPYVGNHTDGDVLIVAQFTNGGRVNEIVAYKWVGGADGFLDTKPVGSGGECDGTSFDVCAKVNDTVLNGTGTGNGDQVPWLVKTKTSNPQGTTYNSATDLDIGESFEGGIDLTALGISGCFNRYLADTRQSTSLESTITDYALGNFFNCTITATKTCSQASVNDDFTTFTSPFTVTITNDSPAAGTVYDASFKETFNFGQTGETCKIITNGVTGTGTAVLDHSGEGTSIESGNLVRVAISLNQGDSVSAAIECSGSLNSFADSIHAVAGSAPGLSDISKNAGVSATSAEACKRDVRAGLKIEKVCRGMELVGGTSGTPITLKANVKVSVTNTTNDPNNPSNELVTLTSLNDEKVDPNNAGGAFGGFTQVNCQTLAPVAADLVLSPDEKACFTGSYTPLAGDLTNPPGTAGFTDTVSVTGDGSISGTFPPAGQPPISASATCLLCDSDVDGIPDVTDCLTDPQCGRPPQ